MACRDRLTCESICTKNPCTCEQNAKYDYNSSIPEERTEKEETTSCVTTAASTEAQSQEYQCPTSTNIGTSLISSTRFDKLRIVEIFGEVILVSLLYQGYPCPRDNLNVVAHVHHLVHYLVLVHVLIPILKLICALLGIRVTHRSPGLPTSARRNIPLSLFLQIILRSSFRC